MLKSGMLKNCEPGFFLIFIFNWRIIALEYCVGFLPCINMNQLRVYICPFPFEPPSHLPALEGEPVL